MAMQVDMNDAFLFLNDNFSDGVHPMLPVQLMFMSLVSISLVLHGYNILTSLILRYEAHMDFIRSACKFMWINLISFHIKFKFKFKNTLLLPILQDNFWFTYIKYSIRFAEIHKQHSEKNRNSGCHWALWLATALPETPRDSVQIT